MVVVKNYTVNTFETFGDYTYLEEIFSTISLEEAKDFYSNKLQELEQNKVNIFKSEFKYEDNGICMLEEIEDDVEGLIDESTLEWDVVSYYDVKEPLKFKIMSWKDGQSDRKEEFRDLFSQNWEDAKQEFRRDIIGHYEGKNYDLTEDDLDLFTETKFSYDTRNYELTQVK